MIRVTFSWKDCLRLSMEFAGWNVIFHLAVAQKAQIAGTAIEEQSSAHGHDIDQQQQKPPGTRGSSSSLGVVVATMSWLFGAKRAQNSTDLRFGQCQFPQDRQETRMEIVWLAFPDQSFYFRSPKESVDIYLGAMCRHRT